MAATLATPSEGANRWYIYVGGKILGPYERPDIESMIANGQLLGTDFLCVEGGAEWIKAQNDPTFGRQFSNRAELAALLPPGVKAHTAKNGARWSLALIVFGVLLFVAAAGLMIANYSKFFDALRHAQPVQSMQTPQPVQSAQPKQPAQPASPEADVLSDHGPKRVACDFKWGALQQRDPSAYPQFLQNCMKGDSGNP
jgi:hypothetical protein